MITSVYAGFSISSRDSTSGRVSTSGIAMELRPTRTCDLRTMVEVDFTSPERVTTGVGKSSRVRRYGNQLARQVTGTYDTRWNGFHGILRLKWHYRIDLKRLFLSDN